MNSLSFPPLRYPSDPSLSLSLLLGSWAYIVYSREGRPWFPVFTCHLDDDRDEGTTYVTLRSWHCSRYVEVRVYPDISAVARVSYMVFVCSLSRARELIRGKNEARYGSPIIINDLIRAHANELSEIVLIIAKSYY